MIITCPKCSTEFEVGDVLVAGRESVKFKCAECAFVWSVSGGRQTPRPAAGHRDMEKSKLMHGLGIAEAPTPAAAPPRRLSLPRNIHYFIFGAAVVLLAAALFRIVSDAPHGSGGGSVFSRRTEKVDTTKLYLELAKPLTLVREGANEYVIMSGFIYNPSAVELPVPRLVIRLENKDGRLLQEQEREIDAHSLPPLGKADFRFKVYKFSDQIVRFVVDFEEAK